MKPLLSFETSEYEYPETKRHVSKDPKISAFIFTATAILKMAAHLRIPSKH
jgi:hypothetical protein